MRLLLQQGWGMMAMDNELIEARIAAGVILSPRSATPLQATNHAEEVRSLGGAVLFDPQFYIPRTEHPRILEYPYWNGLQFDTDAFSQGQAADFCRRVIDYARGTLHADEIILPGTFTNAGDDRWRDWQAFFAQAGTEYCPDIPLYSTIAIGPDVVRSRQCFDSILDEAVHSSVYGVYLLLRPPNDSYLIADENYLYAILDGLVSLSEAGKKVIIGYANQQAILWAAAGVTTIASGNFRNTRSFNPEIFDTQEQDDRQRALWYYDAGTLGEFRIQAMELAYRRGLRGYFGPECTYCSALIQAADPGAVNWREPDAFRHFLFELNRQWTSLGSTPRNTRLPALREILTRARSQLQTILDRGVLAGDRSFQSAFEPSLAALEAIQLDRGMSIGSLE